MTTEKGRHMKKLMLVESPTKAKHISQFLGSDYKVMATKGYMFELIDPKKIPKDKKSDYSPYSIRVNDGSYDLLLDYAHDNRGKSSRSSVADIKKELSSGKYDTLYYSTDPDRAGEGISHQLENALSSTIRKNHITTYRATWHEITKKAVLDGIAHATTINEHMAAADEARSIYDRLFGFSVSPYLWKTVGSGTSGGRAQSPALRLVVSREKDRLAFVKKAYGSIDAEFTVNKDKMTAHLKELDGKTIAGGSSFDSSGTVRKNHLVLTEQAMKDTMSYLRKSSYEVSDITKKPYSRRPQPPYTTSTFQQDVGTRLGLSSKQLMNIAQKLFENGYITYHRTDSIALSSEGIAGARQTAIKAYGKQSVPAQARVYHSKSKNAQEGHEALRPASLDNGLYASPKSIAQRLKSIDAKAPDVYTCVWNRTVASQMNDAKGMTTTITIRTDDSGRSAVFSTAGTVYSELGWMRLTKPVGSEADHALPDIGLHDDADIGRITPSTHMTEPPARFTEPQLVAKLEELGIGRPSTYASIVSVNQERGYVKKSGKALYPTWKGIQVAQILEGKLPSFVDYGYTAKMEDELDKIESGQKKRNDFLDEIWKGSDGISKNVLSLSKNVDWDEINALSTIDLHNDYVVRANKKGAWLEDPSSEPNEKGYRASVKLDDDEMASGSIESDACRELLEKSSNSVGPRDLGVLSDGPYRGWTVTAREGRYGSFFQAVKPDAKKSDSPVNAKFEHDADVSTVTLEDAQKQFMDIRPRQLGKGFFTGVGKRGPWLGLKSKSGRAKFIGLSEELSPLTITVSEAQEYWNNQQKSKG